MPFYTTRFDPDRGAFLDVSLTKPASITFRPGEVDQSKRNLKMLVDTGASKTAIRTAVALDMQLLATGKTPVKSATHEVTANLYLVDLSCSLFNPAFLFPDLEIMAFPFANDQLDGILGRDFLARLVFKMNGPDKTVEFAF